MPARKKNIMRKFVINELSMVDVPAQTGARSVIMKRGAPSGDVDLGKGGLVQAVTGKTNGHQHGIRIDKYIRNRGTDRERMEMDIWIEHASAKNDEGSHSHSVLQGPDGTYTILENMGHTHSLDATMMANAILATVQKQEQPMTEEEKAALEKAQKDAADAAAKAERLDKIVSLSAAHREYFDLIKTVDNQDKFLAKSVQERNGAIAEANKRANDKDPVLHTTREGVEIRKSDGTAALALAKSMDAQAAKLDEQIATNAKLSKANEQAEYEKRAATELGNVSGSIETRAAMLKALDGIEDETARKEALEALKAKNTSMASAFKSIGSSGEIADVPEGVDTATTELDKLVEDYAKANDVSEAAAFNKVLETAKGQELYAQTVAN